MNQELLKKRVELGAEKLGIWYNCSWHNRWFLKVDPAKLNMASAQDDVLGQLYEGYLTGLKQLRIPEREAHLFGFGLEDCSSDREEAAELTLAWRRKISQEVRVARAQAAQQASLRKKKKKTKAVQWKSSQPRHEWKTLQPRSRKAQPLVHLL